jgi:hypothetical protein
MVEEISGSVGLVEANAVGALTACPTAHRCLLGWYVIDQPGWEQQGQLTETALEELTAARCR